MAQSPLKKIGIPRRSPFCTKTREKFLPGSEYLSLISEAENEEELLREDLSIEYWKEHGSPEILDQVKSYWVGKIPPKLEKIKEPEELFQRAREMFEVATEEGEDLHAFLLALYLARKKIFLFRQEIEHGGHLHYLFEVVESGETYSVPVVHPSPEEVTRAQGELTRAIGA